LCFSLRVANWSTAEKRCHKEKQLSNPICAVRKQCSLLLKILNFCQNAKLKFWFSTKKKLEFWPKSSLLFRPWSIFSERNEHVVCHNKVSSNWSYKIKNNRKITKMFLSLSDLGQLSGTVTFRSDWRASFNINTKTDWKTEFFSFFFFSFFDLTQFIYCWIQI